MKPNSSDQFPEWVKVPQKMQNQFFDLAEKEAERTKARLLHPKASVSRLMVGVNIVPVALGVKVMYGVPSVAVK